MRAVVQRVLEAHVTVEGQQVSRIGPGLLVLLGVGKQDDEKDIAWMSEKVANLRIFEDEAGKMNRSLLEGSKALIAVSQFTLYGDARKGRRPTWAAAAPGPVSEPLYDALCAELERLGTPVERGVFGAQMSLELVNDGPVTLVLDSAKP